MPESTASTPLPSVLALILLPSIIPCPHRFRHGNSILEHSHEGEIQVSGNLVHLLKGSNMHTETVAIYLAYALDFGLIKEFQISFCSDFVPVCMHMGELNTGSYSLIII